MISKVDKDLVYFYCFWYLLYAISVFKFKAIKITTTTDLSAIFCRDWQPDLKTINCASIIPVKKEWNVLNLK